MTTAIEPLPVIAMILASRTLVQEHREIAAVAITYGLFLSGILFLTWTMA